MNAKQRSSVSPGFSQLAVFPVHALLNLLWPIYVHRTDEPNASVAKQRAVSRKRQVGKPDEQEKAGEIID